MKIRPLSIRPHDLANYGGGYIVFGFNNDLTRAAQTEFPLIDRDAVAGIVKAYLDPPFQCDVRVVAARSGARHTIIVVPSHGSAPICARRDGPQDLKGRPQGILSGSYYTRKPGPASEPILAPSEWAPLIRRCALGERAAILGAIDAALKGGHSDDGIEARLRQWHEALARSYRERLVEAEREQAIIHGYTQFSLAIHQRDESIAHHDLLRVVEQCNAQAEAIIRMHWGPFVVIHRDPIAPRFRTAMDHDNGEREFLEATLIEKSSAITDSDTWRVSCDGLASLIKGWWEDTPPFGQTPQTCLSPIWFAKEVAGCLLFARAFANNFERATSVAFRCEWTGLRGRQPFGEGRWFRSGHTSDDERRVSTLNISLAELNNGWEAPAAMLAGPVARAVGLGNVLTPSWFTDQAANWARQS